MDFQFNTEGAECDIDAENEYHLEIKIESLTLVNQQINEIQIILIFGDSVNKMKVDGDDATFDGKVHTYVVHSKPSKLAEKLLNSPIMIQIVEIESLKSIGFLILEVNECFANAVKCSDFCSESIRKSLDLTQDDTEGKLVISFSVRRDIGNSNRHREFYTESTKETMKLANMQREESRMVTDAVPDDSAE
ncbi:CLUMA_CG010059, isoform A [Clunio marinus]|uniref:CLUMA_CG010059, isoform A n=1 Tax=Clunio marinus TaxID=568069 RepID=A0A1J1IA83_9DIPT|nr:CLUMA_CG010059, isoform A [Clunio marinus]